MKSPGTNGVRKAVNYQTRYDHGIRGLEYREQRAKEKTQQYKSRDETAECPPARKRFPGVDELPEHLRAVPP